MIRKLTEAAAKNAKPHASGKLKMYSDGGGLSLRVSTTSKLWRYNFRFDGKQKTLSLGQYPEISLKQAREAHTRARELLAQGIDPAANKQELKEKQQAKHQNSFEIVASEWFGKFSQHWTDSHKAKIWRIMERDLFQIVGDMPINEIEPPDILKACNIVVERGSHYSAHKVKQIAGQVFRFAIASGLCTRDAAADLRGALPPVKEKHYPTITKPSEVGELLRSLEGYQGDYTAKQALNILPYLMCRPGELRHMEWQELDFNLSVWIIPAEKMKSRREHKVPLSKQAIAILERVKEHTSGAKYVFHGLRSRDRPLSENTLNAALRRLGYSKEQMVSHGFRGMASSLLNEQGFNPDAIEAQLAHQQGDKVRAAYNRAQYWNERVVMVQHYGDYLDALRSGADVVPIKRNQAN